MKILLVTNHFYPETFKCNDMAFELQRRGHDVTVLTAIPDYPVGKFFNGYGVFKRRNEEINGVKVIRELIIPRGKGGAFRLALNYFSYTLSSSFRALWLGITREYDAVLVHETSPIFVGIPAVIVKKMQRVPLHFWVLDLWPESMSAAGGVKNKRVLSFFGRVTNWIYKNSTSLLIGSKGYRKSIGEMGDYANRIHYFPNWTDDIPKEKDVKFNLPKLPDGFNVVFAGNMGDAQDFPHILDAAKLLRNNKSINFIIIGDGRKKEWVERQIAEHGLSNMKCYGRFPISCMPYFFDHASVLFLALKDEPIFALTAPAKLQAYMSAGKPVVAMINGEGADLIKEADCGWSVPAEDSAALAKLLEKLSNENPDVLAQKGANGKAFSEKHFKFADCIDNLEAIMKQDNP